MNNIVVLLGACSSSASGSSQVDAPSGSYIDAPLIIRNSTVTGAYSDTAVCTANARFATNASAPGCRSGSSRVARREDPDRRWFLRADPDRR